MAHSSFKSLPFALFTSALLTLSSCGEGLPGSVSNVDTSNISAELLDLTATYEGKTYNYVGLMSFFSCAADKSVLPPIKMLATDSRNALEKAFAGGNLSNARSALQAQAKRANPDAPIPDPGLAACPLRTVDEIGTMPGGDSSDSTSEALRVEIENGTKTGGTTAYPKAEARGAGTQVMMFSGGDAGGQATITLPELKGSYQVQLHWLNTGDSPAMAIKGAGLDVTLPDATTENTGAELTLRDLGTHTLNTSAGDTMTFTVLGDTTGQGNAWIGLDYISFTAR